MLFKQERLMIFNKFDTSLKKEKEKGSSFKISGLFALFGNYKHLIILCSHSRS